MRQVSCISHCGCVVNKIYYFIALCDGCDGTAPRAYPCFCPVGVQSKGWRKAIFNTVRSMQERAPQALLPVSFVYYFPPIPALKTEANWGGKKSAESNWARQGKVGTHFSSLLPHTFFHLKNKPPTLTLYVEGEDILIIMCGCLYHVLFCSYFIFIPILKYSNFSLWILIQ